MRSMSIIFFIQFCFLPREATLPPLGEGVASVSEQRPGGLLLGREVAHFFLCLYQTANFYPPPSIKEGGGNFWQIDTL